MKEWISLIVFAAAYALFVVFPNRRAVAACGGALVLVFTGVLTLPEALFGEVSWNLMGLFFGTLVLAELFMLSRAPAVMAEWLVDRTRTARAAMLSLCALAGGISMFVENVAVVLLVAPVALSLADKIKIPPVRLLIGIAVCSNLQGTATMIGDPPSMILAGHMRMGFFDFFFHQGRPGIFFIVQAGGVASMAVLAWLFRRQGQPVALLAVESIRSWVPSLLLAVLVAGLSVATVFDPEFAWFAGTLTAVVALVGCVWYRLRARWGGMRDLGVALDWDTTFFLMGVLIVVGALSRSGWLERLAGVISGAVGTNLPLAFACVVLLAVVVSGFVDNVPFLLAMIPVVRSVAAEIGRQAGTAAPLELLMYGLLIGACLGGNLTPIGASANVVTLGMLRKRGHTVSFREFAALGVPFTAAAVCAASAVLWWLWAP
jgi:Na+/H+ antiporter NhaD/arsenite permease-like protein